MTHWRKTSDIRRLKENDKNCLFYSLFFWLLWQCFMSNILPVKKLKWRTCGRVSSVEEKGSNVSRSGGFCVFRTAQRDPEGAEELSVTQRNITHAGGLITDPIPTAHTRGADERRWSSAVPRIYFLASQYVRRKRQTGSRACYSAKCQRQAE